jgi:hypothetical protein
VCSSDLNSIEQKLSSLTARFENVEKDLRKLIMGSNSALTELTETRHNEAVAMINEVASQIRNEDVSRAFISNLFLEMAMKLSDETGRKNLVTTDNSADKGKKDE